MRAILPAAAVLVAASTSPAAAADRVTRSHAFDLTGVEALHIQGSVGDVDIRLVEGDEIRLDLDIRSQSEGWFGRSRDVSDVDLTSRRDGGRLTLTMDEKNTNTEWTIEMPAVAVTRIRFGVGDIDADVGATELDVEIGVGDVDIAAPGEAVGDVRLSAGVGDARLRGGRIVDDGRAFVSQELVGHGDGDLPLAVEVGVGDVAVRLH